MGQGVIVEVDADRMPGQSLSLVARLVGPRVPQLPQKYDGVIARLPAGMFKSVTVQQVVQRKRGFLGADARKLGDHTTSWLCRSLESRQASSARRRISVNERLVSPRAAPLAALKGLCVPVNVKFIQ